MILYIFLGTIGAFILAVAAFLNLSPQIGGKSSQKFENKEPMQLFSFDLNALKTMYEFMFRKSPDASPRDIVETKHIDHEMINKLTSDDVAITWLGHSSILISTKEHNIITDPILSGKRMGPIFGPQPFPYKTSLLTKDLPKIDVVLISHDHYDHLDMETVQQLKLAQFFVPLGVKAHLLRWGIADNNITEHAWYDQSSYTSNVQFTFTPARHFSGRGLLNRNSTLWGGWVIKLGSKKLFFSGDSGYADEFKKIGQHYGPFDMVMLDTGQYDVSWHDVHMLPEESVQATMDLKAKALMPVHNSKFVLAKHAWYEPMERTINEARKQGISVTTPHPGQTFLVDETMPNPTWWK